MQWYILILSQKIYISFWFVYINVANYFSPCNAMVYSNIILINLNFVTIHETRSSRTKITRKFLGKNPSKISQV